jgi:hypothetical protein
MSKVHFETKSQKISCFKKKGANHKYRVEKHIILKAKL